MKPRDAIHVLESLGFEEEEEADRYVLQVGTKKVAVAREDVKHDPQQAVEDGIERAKNLKDLGVMG